LDCGSPAVRLFVGEELRRRDLQSLSEITSPKALDEKRPVSGRRCFPYRNVGEQSMLAAGLLRGKRQQGFRSPRASGQIHPLPSSLQTQHLCVSFDINIDTGKVISLSKNGQ
jgi:hypothetical protein